jgi:hypothetical protein
MNDIKQITQEVEQKKQAATPKTNGSKPSVKSEVKENYKNPRSAWALTGGS